jgi:hypothetical protein
VVGLLVAVGIDWDVVCDEVGTVSMGVDVFIERDVDDATFVVVVETRAVDVNDVEGVLDFA